MARINVNQLVRGQMVRMKGYFHKLPLYLITRTVLENRALSAPDAPDYFLKVAR